MYLIVIFIIVQETKLTKTIIFKGTEFLEDLRFEGITF